MGAAIAARLSGLGHEIMVWNRSADKARATGLPVAASPQALATVCEAVISMLTDARAVEQVYAQLLKGDVKGKLFIEMSTVRPSIPKALSSVAKEKGAAFVECPVGGSVGPAQEGQLFGFAGAEPADLERARPLLGQLCRRIEHVGPVGAGASMKLAINLPLLVYWQALGESLSLVRNLKLEPQRLMDILGDTSGAPRMLQARGPKIAAALAGRESAVTVNIDTMRKDLSEMLEEARSLGWAAPVTEAALRAFTRAVQSGLGDKDIVMLPVDWSAGPKKL